MSTNLPETDNDTYRLQLGIGGSGNWPLSILFFEKTIVAVSLAEAVLLARAEACDQATRSIGTRACLLDNKDRIRWETRLEHLRDCAPDASDELRSLNEISEG